MYEISAAILIVCYTALAVWAGLVARRNRRRCRTDWALTALVAVVCLVWAAWYVYLLVCHPAAGGITQLLNRTVHAPTIALFAVVCSWRGR